MRRDPENAHEDGQQSRLGDDEWINWQVDDAEPDTFDEWDEDDRPEESSHTPMQILGRS